MATITPNTRTLRHPLTARCSWLATLGRVTGTHPDSGKVYDKPALVIANADLGGPAAAELSANAADLDCWLWRRPTEQPVDRSGDTEVLTRFEQVIAAGIQ
jgi:hypothetical protein